jgi:hypothetical protein
MRKAATSRHVSTRSALGAALFAILVLAGSGLVIEQASRSHAVAVDPHGTALPAQRRLQISSLMPSPSNSDGLRAKLVSGTMPTAAVEATVLTDEQCQPDAHGLSHCLNRLRLPDGSEIRVRHPHDMTLVPCLAPGEHVRLIPTPAT